jgi:hypothetical protein
VALDAHRHGRGHPRATSLRRFGSFWYDFLVGDRWELFVGPIAALAVAALLVAAGAPAAIVAVVLFGEVVAVAGLSIWLSVR